MDDEEELENMNFGYMHTSRKKALPDDKVPYVCPACQQVTRGLHNFSQHKTGCLGYQDWVLRMKTKISPA